MKNEATSAIIARKNTQDQHSHDSTAKFNIETLGKAVYALSFISNNISRDDWLKIGTALKTEFGDSAKADFLIWSDNGKGTDKNNAKDTWRSIQTGSVSIRTLYWYARQHGYTEEKQKTPSADYEKQKARQAERRTEQVKQAEKEELEKLAEQQRAQVAINEVLNHLIPATPNATLYLKNKQSDGQGVYLLHNSDIQKTNTARFTYPFNEASKGALFIPFQNHSGEYVGAQLIYGSKKRNIKGSIKKGAYAYVGLAPLPNATDVIYISEGYSTVNSVLQANPESFGIMAVDAGNLPLVAELIRGRYPKANIIIIGDNDKSGTGQAKAKEAGQYADNVLIPDWIEGQVKSTDFNDVHLLFGLAELENNLNKVISDVSVKNITSKDTVINQKFLGSSLSNALEKNRVLGVLAPYANGKTTAIKEHIKSLKIGSRILFITPRTSLNSAIAGDFDSINFYLSIKNEKDSKLKKELIGSMSCTPQSLGALLDLTGNNHYDLVVFDESEAIASMLVSSVVKDKERTLISLQRVVSESEKIVFMDANYGVDSELLAYKLSGINKLPRLINTYKTWSKINAKILKGGTFSDRKGAINTKIIKAIERGERVAIATSSATYAKDISEIIKAIHPDKIVKLATSSTDNQALVNAPDSVINIDILIYSPSLSVGISFDVLNHFHSVYGVFINEIGTPDPLDAMQSMCRVRHPALNEWTIALDDEKKIYNNHGHDLIPSEIATLYTNLHSINSRYSIGADTPLTDTQRQLIELYATIQSNKRYRKNNFNSLFLKMLDEMQVSIDITNIENMEIDESIKEQIKENKDVEKEKAIVALFSAEKITFEESEKLKQLRHFGSELSQKQTLSLDRYYVETSFNVDFDKLSNSEKREILDKNDSGYISKAKKRAQLFASASFDKEYVKVRLFGLDNEKKSFKKDVLDKHQGYLLLKKLRKYAIPYILEDKEYSHKSLMNSAFYKWTLKNKRKINIISPNLIPANFGAKPASLMSKLLEGVGCGHTSTQGEDKKNLKARTFRVLLDAGFERFYEAQKTRGDNWVELTEKRINELKVVGEAISKDVVKRLQMPNVDMRFMKEQLLQIPRVHHTEIMGEYAKQYDVANPKNKHGIDAPIFANKWLKKQAEKYGEKSLAFTRTFFGSKI
ncbi:MAG: PriCT-2 domain-containing protein [Cocleimonas sp.]|nr:PriCT-2 domain-containing protein [Cocleimonas sp.]